MVAQDRGEEKSFPRGYYFLVDQLNRAALSIATNLAEGNGRFNTLISPTRWLSWPQTLDFELIVR